MWVYDICSKDDAVARGVLLESASTKIVFEPLTCVHGTELTNTMESSSVRLIWRERLTYIRCIERWHHTLGILLMYNKYFSLKFFEAMGSLPYSEPLLSTKQLEADQCPYYQFASLLDCKCEKGQWECCSLALLIWQVRFISSTCTTSKHVPWV